MTISSGQYVIIVRSDDGDDVAQQVKNQITSGKYAIRGLTADNQLVAISLDRMTKTGEYGIIGISADGERAGLTIASASPSVYVSSSTHVYSYTSDGSLISDFTVDLTPIWLCANAAGDFWVTGVKTGGYNIYKYNSSGTQQWGYDASDGSQNICVDSSDNVYCVSFPATADGSGNRLVTVTKVDTDGAYLWSDSKSCHNAAPIYLYSRVCTDISGNLFWFTITAVTVGGYVRTRIDVYKYNAAGTQQWNYYWVTDPSTSFPNALYTDFAITSNNNGGVVLIGDRWTLNADYSHHDLYMHLVEVDSSGALSRSELGYVGQWTSVGDIISNQRTPRVAWLAPGGELYTGFINGPVRGMKFSSSWPTVSWTSGSQFMDWDHSSESSYAANGSTLFDKLSSSGSTTWSVSQNVTSAAVIQAPF